MLFGDTMPFEYLLYTAAETEADRALYAELPFVEFCKRLGNGYTKLIASLPQDRIELNPDYKE